MVNPIKKATKTDDSDVHAASEAEEEEYELLPHKDIVELRQELRKLKSMPAEAGKHAEISFEEMTTKIDKLIEIFEEAEKTIKIEEGAATFKEKMSPIVEKMNTILKQNSEIAEGIVALADIMNEMKDKLEVGVIYKAKEAEKMGEGPMPRPSSPMFSSMQNQGEMNNQFGNDFESSMPPMQPPKGAPLPTPPNMGGPMPMPGEFGGAPLPPLPRAGAPMFGEPAPGPMPMPPPPAGKKGLFGRNK